MQLHLTDLSLFIMNIFCHYSVVLLLRCLRVPLLKSVFLIALFSFAMCCLEHHCCLSASVKFLSVILQL